MRAAQATSEPFASPLLIEKANVLASYLKTFKPEQIATIMKISPALAVSTHKLISDWNDNPLQQNAAIDSFLGDIYSGLRIPNWTESDRQYANSRLFILSGIYGVLRPLDGIHPYRLELGYKLPSREFSNLYEFWGDTAAQVLPADELIINLAAIEYSKLVTPYLTNRTIIAPSFLTVSPKTGQPAFVTVHAKIARGAFANWLIKNRATTTTQLETFNDLGYTYDKSLSTAETPVFVCNTFGGIGLSVRLQK